MRPPNTPNTKVDKVSLANRMKHMAELKAITAGTATVKKLAKLERGALAAKIRRASLQRLVGNAVSVAKNATAIAVKAQAHASDAVAASKDAEFRSEKYLAEAAKDADKEKGKTTNDIAINEAQKTQNELAVVTGAARSEENQTASSASANIIHHAISAGTAQGKADVAAEKLARLKESISKYTSLIGSTQTNATKSEELLAVIKTSTAQKLRKHKKILREAEHKSALLNMMLKAKSHAVIAMENTETKEGKLEQALQGRLTRETAAAGAVEVETVALDAGKAELRDEAGRISLLKSDAMKRVVRNQGASTSSQERQRSAQAVEHSSLALTPHPSSLIPYPH